MINVQFWKIDGFLCPLNATKHQEVFHLQFVTTSYEFNKKQDTEAEFIFTELSYAFVRKSEIVEIYIAHISIYDDQSLKLCSHLRPKQD